MPLTVQAALLGVVQGLTEFLPVSSSAHLILARLFFGFDSDKFGLSFDVACHIGTLIAVLIYFRAEIVNMIAALPRLPAALAQRGATPAGGRRSEKDADAWLVWLIVVGTIPAVIAGLLFKNRIEEELRTPTIAAFFLAVGAIFFFVAERASSDTRTNGSMTLVEVFLVGCAQAVALIPGVSRSGSTLTILLILGLRRSDAARFTFLLGIPAILGAAVSEAPKMLKAGLGGGDAGMLFLIGIVFSALVGFAAVKFFIRYLGNHSLNAFAWYRLALAAATVVWVLSVGA
jgi:undecaprenyl-diphosphatase